MKIKHAHFFSIRWEEGGECSPVQKMLNVFLLLNTIFLFIWQHTLLNVVVDIKLLKKRVFTCAQETMDHNSETDCFNH